MLIDFPVASRQQTVTSCNPPNVPIYKLVSAPRKGGNTLPCVNRHPDLGTHISQLGLEFHRQALSIPLAGRRERFSKNTQAFLVRRHIFQRPQRLTVCELHLFHV